MAEETLSVSEAARVAQVDESTVRRWLRDKRGKGSRVAPQGPWRIDRRDLMRRLGLKEG